MMIWILTAERVGDSNVVLGAWNDLKPAMDVFLFCAANERPSGVEYWELSSWEDRGRRRSLVIYSQHVGWADHFEGKPVNPYTDELVDLAAFAW